jgi:hypothetical protein
LTPNLAFNLKDRADICERTNILFQKNNDSSRLAEEKEEDGGQRRPEKRKEPLGNQSLPILRLEEGRRIS